LRSGPTKLCRLPRSHPKAPGRKRRPRPTSSARARRCIVDRLLKAPTNPAAEPAFIQEFDAIEREIYEVEAALRGLS
jgi:hypothetical protein